ncbi:MAG: hypothetical protein JXB85_00115 [Anaerolineales bacterium]|nr:hypothetical protein [Anaerolineales bacterium]
MRYFLGVDVGATKTHAMIADEDGVGVGFGEAGPGNHQNVGFDGLREALECSIGQALRGGGLKIKDIGGAGFGIAGYDWPSERQPMLEVLEGLDLAAPMRLVNDAIPGLVAGAQAGWGIVVVSGTGCNCHGWDREHKREGRVSGYGITTGEAAGGSELVFRAMHLVNHAWIKRLPETTLTGALVDYAGARDVEDLLEGYCKGTYTIGAAAAPVVFEVAESGDPVAIDLLRWAGRELGEMAWGVIRQLNFEAEVFEVVLAGGMFNGGALLIEPLRETIAELAPGARLVRLSVPPVIGSVIIGMEMGGLSAGGHIRQAMTDSLLHLEKQQQASLHSQG